MAFKDKRHPKHVYFDSILIRDVHSLSHFLRAIRYTAITKKVMQYESKNYSNNPADCDLLATSGNHWRFSS